MIKLNKELLEENFTDKCTFTNCTFAAGKIYKIGRIVFIQITITATISHGWGNIVTLPEELRPFVIYDYGSHISGTECWVYDTGPGAVIRGEMVKDKLYNIVGSYLAQK